MQIHVTIRELMDQNAWEKFCKMRDLNVNAVKEGAVDLEANFSLSVEEVTELGIVPRPAAIDTLSDLEQAG